MITFHNAGCSATVSDAMCRAILEYATALSAAGKGGLADVPTIGAAGDAAAAKVFLVPSSQLGFPEGTGTHPSPGDQSAVAEIRLKTYELVASQTHQHVGPDHEIRERLDTDLDYL
jgi:hypothetical protein